MGIFRTFFTAALALAGVLALAGSARADFAINFVINPYVAGIGDSWFFGINNQGQATGYTAKSVNGSFVQAPVIYQNGTVQNLAPAAPYSFSYSANAGLAINNHGDVVGRTHGEMTYFAAGGVNTPIVIPPDLFGSGVSPTAPLNFSNSIRGLNDSGTVLLNASPDNFPAPAQERFGLWNAGSFTPLTALDPLFPLTVTPDLNDPEQLTFFYGYSTAVTGLNTANQFAGTFIQETDFPDGNYTSDAGGFYYDGKTDTYSVLKPLVFGDDLEMLSMSEDGSALGWSGNRLVTWNPDGTIGSVLPDPGFALQRFGSYGAGSAYRNNLGEVVAITQTGGAAIYSPATSSWRNITPEIAGLGTGRIQSIEGFNDHQQFVGLASPPGGGGQFAYLVSPTPLPPTVLGAGVGALALLAARRLRRGPAAP